MKLAVNISCGFGMFVGVLAAQPLSAQAGRAADGSVIYWQSENWRVVTRNGWCELNNRSLNQGKLRFFRGGAELGYLQYHLKDSPQSEGYAPRIRWIFDGQEYRGTEFTSGRFSPIMKTAPMVQRFKKARRLVIMRGNETVADIPLAGSFRAHTKLTECAAQWPGSRVPVEPPPPVPRRPSKPIPLNPGQWITVNDYKIGWAKAGHHGTVSFVLRVDADGSVDNCSISGGSAPAALKSETCLLVKERARFKPAREANGQPKIGVYAARVKWSLPDPIQPE